MTPQTMHRYKILLILVLLLSVGITPACRKKKARPVVTEKKAVPQKSVPDTVKKAPPAPVTKYYVITGSFLYPENEQRYEGMMQEEGFTPRMVAGESGFHRVAVYAFDSEAEARQKLQEVRSSSPRYRDAWLLVTQE